MASNDVDSVYIKGANNISSKQSLLIIPIIKFFNNHKNLLYLIQILNGETFGNPNQTSHSPISLRLIDWFVTNYCKKKNVMYNIADYRQNSNTKINIDSVNNNNHNYHNYNYNYNSLPAQLGETKSTSGNSFDNYFFVHDNYKSQLKECSKKHFDPFCRRNRIRFYYKPNAYFLTTVGQLNFFKWAIENNVIDYIKDYLADIEKDMNDSLVISNTTSITSIVNNNNKNEKQTRKRTLSSSNSINQKDNNNNINNNNETHSNNNSNTNIPVINPFLAELIPKTKSHKKTSCRQKRKELSISNKSFTKYSIPTVLTFD
jgi:hypothetical protein